MKIPDNVMDVLRTRLEIDGTHLVLGGPPLERKAYELTNDVLEAVGGRWTTRVRAHVFQVDPAAALAPVLESGTVVTLREKQQKLQYFPTPPAVVERLLKLADIEDGMYVLEPSAGSGAIASTAVDTGAVIDCVEQDPGFAAELLDMGGFRSVQVRDFLAVPPRPEYDRVIMNPPFTRGADIEHVTHALRFLRPRGLLVSVMSWSVTEPMRRTGKFRALVEARQGKVEAVEQGAFREAGTDIPTVLVAIPATCREDAEPTVWPTRKRPEVSEDEYRDPLEILAELRAIEAEISRTYDELEEMLTRVEPAGNAAEEVDPTPRAPEQLDLFGEVAS